MTQHYDSAVVDFDFDFDFNPGLMHLIRMAPGDVPLMLFLNTNRWKTCSSEIERSAAVAVAVAAASEAAPAAAVLAAVVGAVAEDAAPPNNGGEKKMRGLQRQRRKRKRTRNRGTKANYMRAAKVALSCPKSRGLSARAPVTPTTARRHPVRKPVFC